MKQTLKEIAEILDSFDFGCKIDCVDIRLWNEETEDFADTIGFTECSALSDAIKNIDYPGEEYKEWLNYPVHFIEVINDKSGNILSVEIEKQEKVEPKIFWIVLMSDGNGCNDLWASFDTKEEAEEECKKNDWKYIDPNGNEWFLYVDEDCE